MESSSGKVVLGASSIAFVIPAQAGIHALPSSQVGYRALRWLERFLASWASSLYDRVDPRLRGDDDLGRLRA